MARLDAEAIAAAVGKSKWYRHVAPAVIARLVGDEIPRSKNQADAEKRTKRRLHQIFGAYADPLPYDRLLERLADAKDDGPRFREAALQVLRGHASTAERIGELDRGFYQRIFEITGLPESVLDLACGLHPVCLPWMGLPTGARYMAADIDLEMIRFLNGFLGLAGVAGRAIDNDLVAGPPTDRADVAFVLKTLPCLAHQTPHLRRILEAIDARWLVVSFPTRSLGRIKKGMAGTYRTMFEELAAGWEKREIELESELVFVVRRG